MSHATTSSVIISPIPTTHSPDAYINVDAQVVDVVTVTGIDRTFDITLSGTDVGDLLNGFDVSGITIDARLEQCDPTYENLTVQMTSDSVEQEKFKAVIRKGLNEAIDGSSNIIDQYLANELYRAFTQVFSGLLPVSGASGEITNLAMSATASGDLVALNATANPAGPSSGAAGAEAITVFTTSQINGFAADVLTDTSEAANDLWSNHNGAGPYLNVLFRQCSKAMLRAYLPADASGSHEVLSTSALPLTNDSTLEFIFDIDVKAAGGDANAESPEAVANQPNLTDGTNNGTTSVAINMGNRRVALKFFLSGSAEPQPQYTNVAITAGIPFGVGSAEGLRANPAAPANNTGTPATDGAGTNPGTSATA